MRELRLRVQTAYGKIFFRPENDLAKIFSDLTGQKTLTKDQIELIKTLGYTVDLILPDLSDFIDSGS